ncbi:MAG: DUF3616 domain-containing protein [Phycisphaerae bacterium]|nr:DUF3616 domain-containing protein [Phycisphaerae bacterium]
MRKSLHTIGIITLITALSFEAGAEQFFRGSADASAAVALDSERFIMADDEDNILRVYNWTQSGSDPNCQTDISAAIGFAPKHPEADIEGATRLNDRIFWITSHGRSKSGAFRPGRCRFFATRMAPDGSAAVEGVYRNLIDDLITYDKQYKLGLQAAIGTVGDRGSPKKKGKLAPKKEGLNIEGLCTTADGSQMFIGFRNPRPNKMALIIPLANPETVVLKGEHPLFRPPILIDLQGLGIRSIEYSPDLRKYLIIAGSHEGGDDAPAFDLYTYEPENQKTHKLATFSDITPEAIFQFPNANDINLLSDDGTRIIDTPSGPIINKELPRERRTFRTRTIKP